MPLRYVPPGIQTPASWGIRVFCSPGLGPLFQCDVLHECPAGTSQGADRKIRGPPGGKLNSAQQKPEETTAKSRILFSVCNSDSQNTAWWLGQDNSHSGSRSSSSPNSSLLVWEPQSPILHFLPGRGGPCGISQRTSVSLPSKPLCHCGCSTGSSSPATRASPSQQPSSVHRMQDVVKTNAHSLALHEA